MRYLKIHTRSFGIVTKPTLNLYDLTNRLPVTKLNARITST